MNFLQRMFKKKKSEPLYKKSFGYGIPSNTYQSSDISNALLNPLNPLPPLAPFYTSEQNNSEPPVIQSNDFGGGDFGGAGAGGSWGTDSGSSSDSSSSYDSGSSSDSSSSSDSGSSSDSSSSSD